MADTYSPTTHPSHYVMGPQPSRTVAATAADLEPGDRFSFGYSTWRVPLDGRKPYRVTDLTAGLVVSAGPVVNGRRDVRFLNTRHETLGRGHNDNSLPADLKVWRRPA